MGGKMKEGDIKKVFWGLIPHLRTGRKRKLERRHTVRKRRAERYGHIVALRGGGN